MAQQRQTEQLHPKADGLDLLESSDIAAILAEGQAAAAASVAEAVPDIARAGDLVARSLAAGGRLVYAAAGSSGLMAMADALELPGTYGIAPERIIVLLAGGMDALRHLQGGPEDDGDTAREAVNALGLSAADCVIVLAASGQTPYAVEAAKAAKSAGAQVVALANNAGAKLFTWADVAIHLPTPPEVIAGSTRMGAGTAQKIALNMISTIVGVRLGHVHDGYMVNVVADNAKLVERARGIISGITGADDTTAEAALTAVNGDVKTAVLVAAGASVSEAQDLLSAHNGFLRPALDALGSRR